MTEIQVRLIELTPKMAREKIYDFTADPEMNNRFNLQLEPYRKISIDVPIGAPMDIPADDYICCPELELALGDHNGLHSQTIGSMTSDSMDSIIMYKGGDYKIRNRIIVQYCPFCGKPRRRASEYKKEK